MSNYRAYTKNIFYKAGLSGFLDILLFRISKVRNWKKNSRFRNQHPSLVIPPDYYLYETYRLDYEQFFLDGMQSAKEIIEWAGKYIQKDQPTILDFGCGVSRIVSHLGKFLKGEVSLHGCDVNQGMIDFNRSAYKGISYTTVPFEPPTSYRDNHFDFIYAISIFTHIRGSLQRPWLEEIHRILRDSGVFLLTTHGRFFDSRLTKSEKEKLAQEGWFTKEFGQEGHRMMSTYNVPENFAILLEPYFEILEYTDGSIDQGRTGGQDLWIVRKKSQ